MKHKLTPGDLVGVHPRHGSVYLFDDDHHKAWYGDLMIVVSVEGRMVRALMPDGQTGLVHESCLIRLK